MLLENQGRSICIRAVEPVDSQWLSETYGNQEFFSQYCSNSQVFSENEVAQLIKERNSESPARLGFVEFVILLGGEKRVGLCTLGSYSELHRRAEVLVGIVDPELRHGFPAVEATLLLLDLAFNHYNLNKVFSYVYAYNEYSLRNTVKLGFAQEGLLKEHHFNSEKKEFIDLYINGMTVSDFRANSKISRLALRLIGHDITKVPTKLNGHELCFTQNEQKLVVDQLQKHQ